MHLSIEIPTLPPPPTLGQGGGTWGIEGTVRPWVGDLSGFALHGSEVGIGLVPSFLTVISSRGHWCRSLDFDGPRLAVLFRHLVLKEKFPNYFSFYFII